MLHDLFYTFVVISGINLLAYSIAYRYQIDTLTDLSYGLSFVAVVVDAFLKYDLGIPMLIVGCLILFWAIRLSSFLLKRIVHMKRDKRFDVMRTNPWAFLKFFLLQIVSAWIIIIPFTLNISQDSISLDLGFWIGLAIWTVGFLVEWISDSSKFRWKQLHPEKPILHGIYRNIRHPNYLGEILCWVGIAICCITFQEPWTLLAMVSPLWISILLVKISGIPLIEEKHEEKYGNSEEFQSYLSRTYRLIPGVY